jgi:hypothetical protein
MLTADDYLKCDVYKQILDEVENDLYKNSVFKSLKNFSSRKKGKYLEMLYSEYILNKDPNNVVEKSENSGHDRLVSKEKKEIKGSFLWGNGTHFRWQQIRPSQDYDAVVFVAVYPDRIEFYEADKETVRLNVEVKNEKGEWIHNQHGGKQVNSGAFFLDGFPSDFPWMKRI